MKTLKNCIASVLLVAAFWGCKIEADNATITIVNASGSDVTYLELLFLGDVTIDKLPARQTITVPFVRVGRNAHASHVEYVCNRKRYGAENERGAFVGTEVGISGGQNIRITIYANYYLMELTD